MRFMDKEEFIERFLYDQIERKKLKPSKKKKRAILPFKEDTYLDLINLFREMYGSDIEVYNNKNKDITVDIEDNKFNIKITAKRDRMAVS